MADLYAVFPFLIWLLVAGVVCLGLIAVYRIFYVKVSHGNIMIIYSSGKAPRVVFTGALIYPKIHKTEMMRISLMCVEIDHRGKEGLICKDNIRADITVAFYIRVNEYAPDILQVARDIGVDLASDHDTVSAHFAPKFSEALKTAAKQFTLDQLFEERLRFRNHIREIIDDNIKGYILEDVAIDYLEQTPRSLLDPDNIYDAEGIRKITEMTAIQNIITNEIKRDQELTIHKKNLEARQAEMELERQRAELEAAHEREIETIRAREQGELFKIQEEERLKAEKFSLQMRRELGLPEKKRISEEDEKTKA
ncbi:hypothetical protein C4J81_04430 [Deltaproteobacteria bacterium Smac51]|nr:hypothetical protein C4J81_04430 [Deltaproteobacteria bacterium Smac51]